MQLNLCSCLKNVVMRQFLIIALSAFLLTGCDHRKTSIMDENCISMIQEWDKTFPLSERVKHEKFSFKTKYRFTLAADLYIPKNTSEKMQHNKRRIPHEKLYFTPLCRYYNHINDGL